VACQPQDNPRSTSSDGVLLELAVLGFCGVSAPTGLTGQRRGATSDDRCNLRILALSCVDQIYVNILFGNSSREEEVSIDKYGR